MDVIDIGLMFRFSPPGKVSTLSAMGAGIVAGKRQKHNWRRSEKVGFVPCDCDCWYGSERSRIIISVLTHNDIAGLESTIDLTYKIASKRLLDIFFDQYHLMDHLQAVKRYILLSAGDFAELLHRNLRYVE
jgi:hypothetical protein